MHELSGCGSFSYWNITTPVYCFIVLVDCKWGHWGGWGDCSEPCGGGNQYRNRIVIEEAENGGNQCGGSVKESRACNVSPCPGT